MVIVLPPTVAKTAFLDGAVNGLNATEYSCALWSSLTHECSLSEYRVDFFLFQSYKKL